VSGNELFRNFGKRIERVLVKRSSGNVEVRDFLVQKTDQPSHQATFGLAFFTHVKHVVTREQRDVDLGDHGAFVSHDPGIKVVTGSKLAEKVLSDLLLYRFRFPATID